MHVYYMFSIMYDAHYIVYDALPNPSSCTVAVGFTQLLT
jgi:hypothetical protein